MNFNTEQIATIEAAQPIWEGYQKSLTMNTGQREIADLRAMYDETFGQDGQYPEWSGGCTACIVNCMQRIYDAYEAQMKAKPKAKPTIEMEKASIATDEQIEAPAKAAKPKTTKK